MATINCSFSDLGDTVRLAWQFCQHNQGKFVAYKAKYTDDFIAEMLSSVQVFVQLDSYNALIQMSKDARQAFYTERDGITDLFKFLKGYNTEIETDAEKIKTLNKEAGQQLLSTLNMKVFKDIDSLISTMLSFINKYATELAAAGMPADFKARIESKRASLLATSQYLETKETEVTTATQTKNATAKELKAKTMAMLADAQLVFRDDKEMAKKFVFDSILAQVQGDKDTGIGGKVTNKANKAPLSNVTINIPALGLSVVTDKDGKYNFLSIPAGVYQFEIKANGFQTVIIEEREVKINIVGRLNIEMEAVV